MVRSGALGNSRAESSGSSFCGFRFRRYAPNDLARRPSIYGSARGFDDGTRIPDPSRSMPGENHVGKQQIHGGHEDAADHHWETDSARMGVGVGNH